MAIEFAKRTLIALALIAGVSVVAAGQGLQGRGGAAQPARSPKEASPVDLTGYWAAAITEDWRFRMVTPPKGDYASVPLNADGTKAADAWDPAKDIAAGEQCRAFGAAGIMRLPVRLHITWQDDSTLKVDIDNGNQVRLFHFPSKGRRLRRRATRRAGRACPSPVGRRSSRARASRQPRADAATRPLCPRRSAGRSRWSRRR